MMTAQGRGAGADAYQHAVLVYFWTRTDAGADRLALLQELAQVVVERPDTWDIARVRRESGAVKIPTEACFCCRHRDRAIDRHHIVQVHQGGSNASRNFVPLCRDCHARVHPHMEPAERPGWVGTRDLVAEFFSKNKRKEIA
jgi:hypothetical protein